MKYCGICFHCKKFSYFHASRCTYPVQIISFQIYDHQKLTFIFSGIYKFLAEHFVFLRRCATFSCSFYRTGVYMAVFHFQEALRRGTDDLIISEIQISAKRRGIVFPKIIENIQRLFFAFENKVKDNIEKSVENNPEMQRLIFDVRVPVEDVVEIKGNKRVKSQRKVYPGYVLVHMIETSESWYLVRNTRGVTGFVGPDSKPVALTPAEVDMMLSTQQNSVEFGIAIGEEVRILSGPLENFTGVVEDVDTVRQKLTVKVKMFLGREMPVEVDLQDVEKVQPK